MEQTGREIVLPYMPRPPQPDIHALMEGHRFSVIAAHRRLGKTVCTVNQLIKWALLDVSGTGRYGYVAPYRNQAKSIAWDYLKYFSAPVPGRTVNEGELAVSFPNGARIRLFGADNADAMRGLYFDGVVLDEVADMRPEVWGEIVRPALTDRLGRACFIGTPKGMNLFYELYTIAQNTQGWGCAMYRADETGVIPQEELEAAASVMSANQYRQEFLCDFSASVDNVLITIDLVSRAAARVLLEADVAGAPRVIGVDVARFGDDRSAICRRQGLWCQSIRTLEQLDNMTFAGIIAREIDAFNPDAVFIDAGRGEGVIDRLRQMGYDVMEVNFGGRAIDAARCANRRAEMWDGMRAWLESGGSIPNDPGLKGDLSAPTYSFDAAGRLTLEPKEKMKERGMRSPDLADALALTFAAPVRAQSEYAPPPRRSEDLFEWGR